MTARRIDRLIEDVEKNQYNCTCKVGGQDAMSIDSDYLLYALTLIREMEVVEA